MAQMTLDEIETLATNALVGAGTSATNAGAVARSTRMAERDGVRSHGLMYVPIYAEHVHCGKVDGKAEPAVETPKPALVRVDAKSGFAHPAIDAGFDAMVDAARSQGVGVMSIFNSYNCGVLGHHAERIARAGLLGLCFTNAPASIAPAGGKKPVVGTNPFALGVPGPDGEPTFVIDQSASAIAKSEIMLRNREGEPIPEGWALDADGNPTTDPAIALKGSMVPSGGAKGFGAGLMVEVFAAALSGAVLGKDSSPFSGTVGGPPNTGQTFIAIDPDPLSSGGFGERVAALAEAITAQEGSRLPGSRRVAARANTSGKIEVPDDLVERIRAFG
ncbi:Ldh family oxidoreductase [Ahrensia sp. R2A130]|uniref:Ldh family oxidoreductase n=1 Tax=Ahrensia sp. R2A130 TaxID=744979 RepID=UPI0001E0D0D1|nr:Ldh family oxidoreductase [Ahrensia sp. R2A130]EFL90882.1 malate/L-lactate dehydrogenase family protein [Ahrensia sp. R2A130]